MSQQIIFGTSGHRGIVGETFALAHVTAICHAVADYVLKQSTPPTVIVGYDPREGNDPNLGNGSFTKQICDTLRARGVTVHFCATHTPTPIVSWYITHHEISGGLILTASHNPPNYNGIKFNPANGAPAPKPVTDFLEKQANIYFDSPPQPDQTPGKLIQVVPTDAFCSRIIRSIEVNCNTNLFQLPDFPIVIDAKHGTCATTWELLLTSVGLNHFKVIHADPQSNFGNIEPNPTDYDSLKPLQDLQQTSNAPIAIANDPDGDRHVILDETGEPITPEEVTLIILDWLLEKDIHVSGLGTTLASSRIIKSAANYHNIPFEETAVGFKYLAPFLEKAKNHSEIALAVESSGGFSASFHTLEKCGFLPGLLLIAIYAETGTALSQLKKSVRDKYGQTLFLESKFTYPSDQKEHLKTTLPTVSFDTVSAQFPSAGETNTTDGLKIVLSSGDWTLIRLSGTEPVARIYAEADNKADAERLIRHAKALLNTIVKT